MIYYVYALYSQSFDTLYVGYTSDLEARFKSHNQLATKGWTVRYRPWVIIHTEEFTTKAEALKRERQLKSAKGRVFLRAKIT